MANIEEIKESVPTVPVVTTTVPVTNTVPEVTTAVPEVTEPLILTRELCVKHLLECNINNRKAFNLKEAEIINRAVRYLQGRKQLVAEYEKELDFTKAVQSLVSGVGTINNQGLLTLDESAFLCILAEFLDREITTELEAKKPKAV
jgi:hypothetical protein